MDHSDERLNRLLRQAFPPVEVSPDFTLRLWHKLVRQPVKAPWMPPVPVAALAVLVGLVTGIWTAAPSQPSESRGLTAALRQADRLDLFGNAPLDSVAGSYLLLRFA